MFWYQGIAKVSAIILTPDSLYQKADITIAAWCDTEAAYEFIQKLVYQDETIHGDWIVQDNSTAETRYFYPSFYEALCEDVPERWTEDDDQMEEEASDFEALEEGEIYDDEGKPVIRVYQGCEKYTISEAKSALELLYRYLECGYCGMAPQQIAETIGSVEAQLSLYGIETPSVREPIAPALPAEPRIIPNYSGGDYMTIPEAIARVELLSELVLVTNFTKSTQPSFQEAGNVFDYCEEIDFIEEFFQNHTTVSVSKEDLISRDVSPLYPIDSIAKLQQVEF